MKKSYQIVTTIMGNRIEGKTFDSHKEVKEAVKKLCNVYKENNFPAQVSYVVIQ